MKNSKFYRLSRIAKKYEVETELKDDKEDNIEEGNQGVNPQEIEYVNGPKKVIIRSENVRNVYYEGSSSSSPVLPLILLGIVGAIVASNFQDILNGFKNVTRTNYTAENKSYSSDIEKLKKQEFDVSKLKYMDDKEFLETIAPYAIVLGNNNKIYPSVFLAQIIWESGWGNRHGKNLTVEKCNNLFGIKADTSWEGKSENLPTEQDAQPTGDFRTYETPFDSMVDYVKFLNENSRYEKAIKCYEENKGGKAQAREIARAGYSEVPEVYESELIGSIEDHNLEQYDNMTLEEFMNSRKTASAMIKVPSIAGDDVTLVYDDKTKRYTEYTEYTEEPEL